MVVILGGQLLNLVNYGVLLQSILALKCANFSDFYTLFFKNFLRLRPLGGLQRPPDPQLLVGTAPQFTFPAYYTAVCHRTGAACLPRVQKPTHSHCSLYCVPIHLTPQRQILPITVFCCIRVHALLIYVTCTL